MDGNLILWGLGGAAGGAALMKLRRRWQLSRAKHPSLRGHARLSRRLAAEVPFYAYDEETFFRSDDAPEEVAARRRAGFFRLAGLHRSRFAR
jgi:glutamate-1-semialdehyde 2,1-aminomutase